MSMLDRMCDEPRLAENGTVTKQYTIAVITLAVTVGLVAAAFCRRRIRLYLFSILRGCGMKRSWIRFLLIVLLLLLPIAATAAVGFLVPAQFEMTFLGEFDNKVERLQNTDGPKVILVGGSSVAFGVDAELLEQTLGMPVINFRFIRDARNQNHA